MAIWQITLPTNVLVTNIGSASNRYEEEDEAIAILVNEFRDFAKQNIKKIQETNPSRPAMDSATRSRQ